MTLTPIAQCDKALDFKPRSPWNPVLPAYAWQDVLLCGFERERGEAVDLWRYGQIRFTAAFTACHPTLGLGELARLRQLLVQRLPEWSEDADLYAFYGFRWSDRLSETLSWLESADRAFQDWVDEKKLGPRDLAPLLTLPSSPALNEFLEIFRTLPLSKSQATRALENIVDIHLMGRPLKDLLPVTGESAENYLSLLEVTRRPMTAAGDERWRSEVSRWPWPSQVQAEWRRQGDQAGLEIKLRATSPQDFRKKLERLNQIGEDWSCKN